MQVIHDALKSADLPYGAIATIGNYDGIHRGQRTLIEKTVERAREEGVSAAVISFEPHPLRVLRPETAPKLLTTSEQRERLLREAGVDHFLLVRFSQEFARTSARDFVRGFLHEKLALQELYVGSGFMFGHGREGDVGLLESMGEDLGFRVVGVEEVRHEGEVVSSTRARRAIEEGKVELALELLGRAYALRGEVARGDRMGARLGWPTINLMPENELVPSDGVYAGRVFFPSFPATFECVTNVGTRPTVYENYQRVVESHILGFSAQVYGETVEVSFHKRLREERIFPTVMDLSAQIGRDVEATREFFSAQKRLGEEMGESG